MSRPNPYINTIYLAVHFALNVLVILLVADVIDTFFSVRHLFIGYEVSVLGYYQHMDFQKNIALFIALVAVAAWYYQRRKAKNGEAVKKH